MMPTITYSFFLASTILMYVMTFPVRTNPTWWIPMTFRGHRWRPLVSALHVQCHVKRAGRFSPLSHTNVALSLQNVKLHSGR